MKKITQKIKEAIETEVKYMLHAHRDALRTRGTDTMKITFSCHCAYYGEAFGIMRGLKALNYGDFESINMPGTFYGFAQDEQNLRWWLARLEDEVLKEEHYESDGRCEYCLKLYRQDDKSIRDRPNV